MDDVGSSDAPGSSSVGAGANSSTTHRLFSPWPRVIAGADRIAAAIATSRKLIQADRAALRLDKFARDFGLFGSWVIANRPTNAIVPTHPALLGIDIGDLLNQGCGKAGS